MARMKRVLVTGAAGRIGGMVLRALAGSYELSGVDVRPVHGLDCRVADMTDFDAVRPAFSGVDIVVDLANDPSGSQAWSRAYGNNIPATYNALRAAREAGVERYIFTSSNRVVEGYERDHPYSAICRGAYESLTPATLPLLSTTMPVRPNGPYGIAKACGEAAARYFSDEFAMSVICLRLGTVDRGDGQPHATRQFATLLTAGDLARLYECAVSAPETVKFAVFFGVSDNTWRFWDIADAERLIGYQPRDNAETWRGRVEFPATGR